MTGEKTSVWVDDPKQEHLRGGYLLAIVVLLALVVCCVAVSNQSFWLDEAVTVLIAKQPTLGELWRALVRQDAPFDLVQQPFFFLFVWAWEKLVGLGEFAMRAGNLPWFLVGLITTFCALQEKPLLRWSFFAVLLSSPFAWYYLNEVRPYAMEIGLCLVVFAGLYRLGLNPKGSTEERGWVITLCLGSLLLSATSILAMLWLGAYWGAAVLSTPKDHRRRLTRDYWVYWGLTLTLLFALGVYYLWTLRNGPHIALTGKGGTDIRNVMFVAYELLGFSGLGPGRVAIRNGGLGAFRSWLPWLVIYGGMLLVVLIQGWKQIASFGSQRARIFWVAAPAIVAGFILANATKLKWSVLGRHYTPLLVPVLFVLAAGVARLVSRKNVAWQALAVAFVGLNVVSDLNLRCSERHAKDDSRAAAAIAVAAVVRGERVWWCADSPTGIYYGVPLSQMNVVPAPGQAWYLENPPEHLLDNQPPPQLVVLSSKMGYTDKKNQVRTYLEQRHYSLSQVLPSFTVWRR